jgi:hypothetical protein
MATEYNHYEALHPGQMNVQAVKNHHIPLGEPGGRMASTQVGALLNKNTFPIVGGGFPYTAGSWTIVTGGTGDAQAEAATAGGGVLITAASDDNFDTTLTSVQGITPATGKWLSMMARFQVSDADGIGFYIGLTTGGGAAALPFGTNYTDAIALRKAIAAATVTGHAREKQGRTTRDSRQAQRSGGRDPRTDRRVRKSG